MKYLWHLVLVSGLFISSLISVQAFAKALDPANYLDKISQRLTGKWPLPEEYDSLTQEMKAKNCQQVSCLDEFFKAYIRRKMDAPEFYSEATLKVFEKFSFQTPPVPPFPLTAYGFDYYNAKEREELLVYKVFHDDLAIDEIYTSQSYWERINAKKESFDKILDFSIESDARATMTNLDLTKYPDLNLKNSTNTNYSGDATNVSINEVSYKGHPNIAGMFSSNRFLTRYWNTPVNGNRKRAAAIFRIMLCDSMSPALERETQKKREEALALGISDTPASSRTLEEIHKNRHGNQKDCAQCHTRLDPVARTLRPLELGIAKLGVPGNLRFYNAVNQPQDIPVQNFHELIVKATQLERYNDCQMNWLFNWIVGKDTKIHPLRFEELLNNFQTNRHHVKATIEALLQTPEFRGEESSYVEPHSLVATREVFSNCAFCHTPFLNMRGDELKLMIAKISHKLDLPYDGAQRTMPPSDHFWEPSDAELQSIKQWVEEGAPLAVGKSPLLTPDESKTILRRDRGDK